jgi:hypothetical protein
LRPSLALWLEVLNILKCTQIRNMQALLEGGKIHILPLLEEHLGFIRDSNPVHDLLSCVGWRRIFCRYFLMHNFGGMTFLCKVFKQGTLVVLLTRLKVLRTFEEVGLVGLICSHSWRASSIFTCSLTRLF